MKNFSKLFITLFFLLISNLSFGFNNLSYSFNENNINKFNYLQNEIVDVNNNVWCNDVTVGVNLGIFYIETTITVCCIPTGLVNCCCGFGVPPKENSENNKPGIITVSLSDLLKTSNYNTFEVKELQTITIQNSTRLKDKNFKIIDGVYSISKDNTVDLKFEYNN